ncbi:MAG: type II toxin-antitoxin system RelE/ParE family toxin [Saprospiraceae bacterium]|nr:type II toxin-antitoxin system RelE/ParE family toxin [Saprospiraceae bacterium]
MKSDFVREVVFYGEHFRDLYHGLNKKTRLKIDWTINLLETVEKVPEKYFKHLAATEGLYEIRVECESNIYRFFSFFDKGKLIIAINGFQKKTNKTPKSEIEKALKIKKQYFNEKQ